ncbi:MAG TPA: DUF2846 domain-containing protein [Phycisphaerae bacterium]|nr:DUF2846 domain-containing protein [Phycisphaerae bacterium]
MIGLRGSIKIVLGIIGLFTWAAGCATVPTTDTSANAAAKTFEPELGMASVYLCRPSAVIGDTLVAQTELDGQMIGALAPNTFLLVSVAPGQHTFTVVGPTNEEQTSIDAVAGNVYFFKVSITWAGPGVRHRHIEAMSDADGRNDVNAETRAVATTNPATTNPE